MTTKEKGDVYTPEDIVEHVLDIAGYKPSPLILGKKVIDPSCGDGAFLRVVAQRLIAAGRDAGLDDAAIAGLVLGSVSGIEIVPEEAAKSRDDIVRTCWNEGIVIDGSKLDIACADALDAYSRRAGQYDFVVGNPPYVRIHNLENSHLVQSMSYCGKGMTDLYLAFYELGQELCKDDGTLCYIAPSSWFSSKSGETMREDLRKSGRLVAVVDLRHFQPFDGITTYTAIVKMTRRGDNDDIGFATFGDYLESGDGAISPIPYDDAWIGGMFMPVADDKMRGRIREIMTGDSDGTQMGVRVKNGFATNLDRFFIRDSFPDEGDGQVPQWIRPIVKSSTTGWAKCFYPYDEQGSLLPLSAFDGCHIHDDLMAHKEDLLARNQIDNGAWWGYARSQGIADVERDKVAVNSLYRDAGDLKVVPVGMGACVYGGVYVLGMGQDEVERACSSDVYMEYVRSLRKYKSGGYYAIGGKELERFLRWWTAGGASQEGDSPRNRQI